MSKLNPIIMIQMLMQYYNYSKGDRRTFRFTKNGTMRIHQETIDEMHRRKSILSLSDRMIASNAIRKALKESLKGKIGTVYIQEKMKNIALPLQMSTSESGYGVLTTGSRIDIPKGRFIRAFTYWEKVNDIDLSCFAITKDGKQREFSWRNMYANNGDDICFSGDETSGYYGGSEYFDINIELFRVKHPEFKYLIFCDNIYTGGGSIHFKDCLATGGFMIREKMEPNTRGRSYNGIKKLEIFDPKTVETSFKLHSDSSFCYMFGIDLEARQMVWIDVTREGNYAIAGETKMDWLLNYMASTKVYNLYDFFTDMASEITNDMSKADIIVTDEMNECTKNGAKTIVHSWDTEKIFEYLKVG